MYALVGDEAKVNLAFSVGRFGELTQNAARQDGGDLGGALGGGELVGWERGGQRIRFSTIRNHAWRAADLIWP